MTVQGGARPGTRQGWRFGVCRARLRAGDGAVDYIESLGFQMGLSYYRCVLAEMEQARGKLQLAMDRLATL